MIKVESGSFAALVRSYKKSLNMLAVLQHLSLIHILDVSQKLANIICEILTDYETEIDYDLLKKVLVIRSEEHTSELQSHYSISYAVFCLKKKNTLKIKGYEKDD